MKKDVIYNVDILVNSNSVIVECQYECAAGMGPRSHSKHVCATLYDLCIFSKKKEICVEETCTEKLQTFHRSKKFQGSPLKSAALTLRKKYSHEGVFNQINFDPRPSKFKKSLSYPAYFQNACLNFAHNDPQMPVLETIPPANLKAVAHGHDYVQRTSEDVYFSELYLLETYVHRLCLSIAGHSRYLA